MACEYQVNSTETIRAHQISISPSRAGTYAVTTAHHQSGSSQIFGRYGCHGEVGDITIQMSVIKQGSLTQCWYATGTLTAIKAIEFGFRSSHPACTRNETMRVDCHTHQIRWLPIGTSSVKHAVCEQHLLHSAQLTNLMKLFC